jgi:hypothetical protein
MVDWWYRKQALEDKPAPTLFTGSSADAVKTAKQLLHVLGVIKTTRHDEQYKIPYPTKGAKERFIQLISKVDPPGRSFNGLWCPYDRTADRHTEEGFKNFTKAFPKDQYLSQYADISYTILLANQHPPRYSIVKEMSRLEQKHKHSPRTALMISWWKAVYMGYYNMRGARSAFRHIVTHYKQLDWNVVSMAKSASLTDHKGWVHQGLFPDMKEFAHP